MSSHGSVLCWLKRSFHRSFSSFCSSVESHGSPQPWKEAFIREEPSVQRSVEQERKRSKLPLQCIYQQMVRRLCLFRVIITADGGRPLVPLGLTIALITKMDRWTVTKKESRSPRFQHLSFVHLPIGYWWFRSFVLAYDRSSWLSLYIHWLEECQLERRSC